MRRKVVIAVGMFAAVLAGLQISWWLRDDPRVGSPARGDRPVAAADAPARRPRAKKKPRAAPPPATPPAERPAAPGPGAPAEGAVFGRVKGAERLDDGTVFVEGCGVDPDGEGSAIDQDGGFFLPMDAQRCRLRAWRRHGALRLPGEWVEVDTTTGEVDVELDVPTFAPAGMGIGFRPSPDGVVIEQVHPGTPAFEAGLLPGDVITDIDGHPTEGVGMEEFLRYGIGPAGTTVHLVGVSADGEPFDTAFPRREIVLD